VDNPNHHPKGDFTLMPSGRVTEVPQLTFSGISILSPQLFSGITAKKFPLAPLLKQAMSQYLVSGERLQGFWCDVGTPQRLDKLEKMLGN
jgi:MurNAc alpha-1-phosphate uridylyltransferase